MGQDQAGIMGRIKRMGVWFPRSKWAKWGKGFPWCRPPALLPYSGHAPKRAACPSVRSGAYINLYYIVLLVLYCITCIILYYSAVVSVSSCGIFVYISSPDISSVDTSSGEVYFHPSSTMHLSAHSRSMVATGSPFHAA